MKKLNRVSLFMLALVLFLNTHQARAQIPIEPGKTCVISKIDGDKVPFPLREANTKFELADNETYILNGFIVTSGDQVFFKIDFDSQPWLATQSRVENPLLLIDSESATALKQYENSGMIQMAVVIHNQSSKMVLKLIVPAVKYNRLDHAN